MLEEIFFILKTSNYPILLEGQSSTGKSSAVQYLAGVFGKTLF